VIVSTLAWQRVSRKSALHCGITLARQDCADDPQPSRAGNVGDDVVELKIHLGQRHLHVLDVRGGIFEQTLALAQVGPQFPRGGDLV
jgi:hypothetical protein